MFKRDWKNTDYLVGSYLLTLHMLIRHTSAFNDLHLMIALSEYFCKIITKHLNPSKECHKKQPKDCPFTPKPETYNESNRLIP